ncbi:MAG: ABC transporter ATP-binding protein [Planctomycetes bacterium]|nr:ABC transporter ATP-binding protein [Planctomycetota bacterium]
MRQRFRRFLPFFLRYRKRILLGLLCIPLSQGLRFLIPFLIQDGIDRVVGDGNYQDIGPATSLDFLPWTIASIIAIALFMGLFRFAQRWWIVGASRLAERDLKDDLFDKLTTLDPPFYHRMRSGDLLSRATADLEAIRMFLGPGVMYTAGTLVSVPIAFAVMLYKAPLLCAAVSLPLLLLAYSMRRLYPVLETRSMAVQEGLGRISEESQENFAGIRVVKAYAREEFAFERFDALCDDYRERNLSLARARGLLNALLATSKDLAALLILFVGGLAMLGGTFSVGEYYLFTDYMVQLYWPLIAIGWWVGMYHRAAAAATRLNEVYDAEPAVLEPANPVRIDSPRGAVRVRDLTFGYDAATPVLHEVTVDVPAGTSLGVVGKTGAGKSTFVNLFDRLYRVPRGTIFIDGVDLQDIPREQLRELCVFVPQDNFLYNDTLRANVAFGRADEPTEDEILTATERAMLAPEVRRFPRGLDTLIGERGVTLSGGQKQRTCIARALVLDPRILILDDCLSSVDTSTEAELLPNLRRAARDRTLLIVAHRLSTVKDCERIIVLDEGRIVEEGTHAELIARPGSWYAETWTRQQIEGELDTLQ